MSSCHSSSPLDSHIISYSSASVRPSHGFCSVSYFLSLHLTCFTNCMAHFVSTSPEWNPSPIPHSHQRKVARLFSSILFFPVHIIWKLQIARVSSQPRSMSPLQMTRNQIKFKNNNNTANNSPSLNYFSPLNS